MRSKTLFRPIIAACFLFAVLNHCYAQTFNPTYTITAAGSADSFKGGYTFAYTSSGSPWAGAFMSFGGAVNNYDCQISALYGAGGNHMSFRTHNGSAQQHNNNTNTLLDFSSSSPARRHATSGLHITGLWHGLLGMLSQKPNAFAGVPPIVVSFLSTLIEIGAVPPSKAVSFPATSEGPALFVSTR